MAAVSPGSRGQSGSGSDAGAVSSPKDSAPTTYTAERPASAAPLAASVAAPAQVISARAPESAS